MPQCAVIGWPGQTGQALAGGVVADGEDEIDCGASGSANSLQLFERKPSVG